MNCMSAPLTFQLVLKFVLPKIQTIIVLIATNLIINLIAQSRKLLNTSKKNEASKS